MYQDIVEDEKTPLDANIAIIQYVLGLWFQTTDFGLPSNHKEILPCRLCPLRKYYLVARSCIYGIFACQQDPSGGRSDGR